MTVKAILKSVLITGCSTGIGRATALWLAERGWKVYATARRRESLADLEGKVAAALPLDVCGEASMGSAVRTIEEKDGAVGVLVNNAGMARRERSKKSRWTRSGSSSRRTSSVSPT